MYRVKVVSVSVNPEYVKKATGEKTGATNIVFIDDNSRAVSQFFAGVLPVKEGDFVDLKVCSYFKDGRTNIYLAFGSVVKG